MLFITHGGLFSTIETTYHGVPVIGIPLFGDQNINMEKTAALGAGMKLEWSQLTESYLYKAVKEVLQNPRWD